MDVDIANSADDSTPYATHKDINQLLLTLQRETSFLFEWFKWNEMKPNEDKSHLFVVNKSEEISIKINKETLLGAKSVNLLGIQIDNQLDFSEHVTKLCKTGNQKLHALARISKYMNKEKIKILMKTFITSQFNYNPLVWMFHNRTINNKINRLHERALRLVYSNHDMSFQELLDRRLGNNTSSKYSKTCHCNV